MPANIETTPATKPNLVKGCTFSLIAFFFFALLGLTLKGATLYGATSLQATFWVYVFATLLTTPVILQKGISILKTQHFKFHFFRAGYGVIATLLYVYAMQHIPVVNATLLFNTAPIFIPLFAIFLLKQPVTKKEWIAILVGFIGVSLVIKPTIDILENPTNVIGLLAGAFLAVAFIYIKKLSATDPTLRIVYYFFLISTVVLLPIYLYLWKKLSLQSLGFAAAAGCCLVATQYFLVKAYQYGKPSKVGIFQYATVVFVGFIEWAIWGLRPSLIDFIGFVLVASAGTAIIIIGDEEK